MIGGCWEVHMNWQNHLLCVCACLVWYPMKEKVGTVESALDSFEGISNLITPEPARHKKGILFDSGDRKSVV